MRMVALSLFLILDGAKSAQSIMSGTLIGGSCEGCEAIFEFGDTMPSVDTSADFNEKGPKCTRIKISGRR